MMKIFMGREVETEIQFTDEGTFEAYWAAQTFIHRNGYSDGSTCCTGPVALVKGKYNLPQKWHNFDDKDIASVDGVLTGNTRKGPVTVYFFKTNANTNQL